jgi:hypothetical protein
MESSGRSGVTPPTRRGPEELLAKTAQQASYVDPEVDKLQSECTESSSILWPIVGSVLSLASAVPVKAAYGYGLANLQEVFLQVVVLPVVLFCVVRWAQEVAGLFVRLLGGAVAWPVRRALGRGDAPGRRHVSLSSGVGIERNPSATMVDIEFGAGRSFFEGMA